jgi:hypothetical protein
MKNDEELEGFYVGGSAMTMNGDLQIDAGMKKKL